MLTAFCSHSNFPKIFISIPTHSPLSFPFSSNPNTFNPKIHTIPFPTNPIAMSSPKAPLKSEGFLATSEILVQPSSPWFLPSRTPTAEARRKIGIVVDLSDGSTFSIKWAVQNYLCPRGAVVLLHISSISILYGADWGWWRKEELLDCGSSFSRFWFARGFRFRQDLRRRSERDSMEFV